MNFRDCLLARLLLIVGELAFVVIGFLLILAVGCLLTSGPAFLGCMAAVLAAAWPILLGLLGIAALLLLMGAVIDCSAAASAAVDVESGSSNSAIADNLPADCASAQEALSRARQALSASEMALARQREVVSNAERRLNQAKRAVVAAAAALAAALFQPWLWPGALAAVAAATALVISRTNAYNRELAKLSPLELAVTLAYADVAAAEALVLSLCQPDVQIPGGILQDRYAPVVLIAP
jgi:hypothetical protein